MCARSGRWGASGAAIYGPRPPVTHLVQKLQRAVTADRETRAAHRNTTWRLHRAPKSADLPLPLTVARPARRSGSSAVPLGGASGKLAHLRSGARSCESGGRRGGSPLARLRLRPLTGPAGGERRVPSAHERPTPFSEESGAKGATFSWVCVSPLLSTSPGIQPFDRSGKQRIAGAAKTPPPPVRRSRRPSGSFLSV